MNEFNDLKSLGDQLVILGKPTPLARPRVTKTHTYDKQRQYKDSCIYQLKAQKPKTYSGPLALTFLYLFAIPKTRKDIVTGTYHHSIPDLDNLIKMTNDLLVDCGILKDQEISKITTIKIYSDLPTSTQIFIKPL